MSGERNGSIMLWEAWNGMWWLVGTSSFIDSL